MILVLEGSPIAHIGEKSIQMSPGDFLGFPLGNSELHFVENATQQNARFLVISSKAANDSVAYAAKTSPCLRTERLILRLAEEKDVPAILRYFRENEARFAPTDPPKPEGFHTERFWRERARKSRGEFAGEQSLRFFLFEVDNDSVVVGTANFTQMVRGPFHACYLGYTINGRHEGQGLMTEALSAAIRYLFSELNFHRIMANYLPENERSARLLKRLGFVVEGRAPNCLSINGQWRDHVLAALTNSEWRAMGPDLQ